MEHKYKFFSFIIIVLISLLGWFYIIQPEILSRETKVETEDITKVEKFEDILKKEGIKVQKKEQEFKTIALGLDLIGGSQLLYDADVSKLEKDEIDGAMESLKETLTKRLNAFGTSEVSITIERVSIFSENNEERRRLIIEIPGISDVEEAKRLIGKIPLLEFKIRKGIEYQNTGLTGKHLKDATLTTNQAGLPAVLISFNDEGTEIFAKLTAEYIGEQMGIFIDGFPISEPILRASITNGVSIIEGGFSFAEAQELTQNLKFGALPVPIKLISSDTISASLGEIVLSLGLKAAIIGFLLVAVFLILFYRISGFIAVIALISYTILTLSIFKLFSFVFTAAGIAGFIISIGLAVDANVLIFERIKEELKNGRKMYQAIEVGFKRAWLSIRDGNLSSILTAIILFFMTTSLVQGFSLTFGFGVLVSMFSAIVLTRTFLLSIVEKSNKKSRWKIYFGNWNFFNNKNKKT